MSRKQPLVLEYTPPLANFAFGELDPKMENSDILQVRQNASRAHILHVITTNWIKWKNANVVFELAASNCLDWIDPNDNSKSVTWRIWLVNGLCHTIIEAREWVLTKEQIRSQLTHLLALWINTGLSWKLMANYEKALKTALLMWKISRRNKLKAV